MTNTGNPLKSSPDPAVANPVTPGSYKPTKAEVSLIESLARQMRAELPVPRLKASKDGRSVSLDHADQTVGWGLLMNALGTTDLVFAEGVKCQLASMTSVDGEIHEGTLNFALSTLAGIKPSTQEEALLGVLHVASYLCALKMAGHLYSAQTTGELDYAERTFNKLARTCAMLSETLMRRRAGTQHDITVQNVSVRDNAQAVVTGPRSKGPPKGA